MSLVSEQSRHVVPAEVGTELWAVLRVRVDEGPEEARPPVPLVRFCLRISVAFAATPSGKIRVRFTRKRGGSESPFSTRPSGNLILVIAVGRTRRPPFAIDAYAVAISSGETPFSRPPSVSAG